MIRVAVAAQALALRAGLTALLSAGESVEVVAEAAALVDLTSSLPEIDVLVLAASRPQAELRELAGEALPAVLLLSSESSAAQALAGLRVSAWGVLPLDSSADELLAAVAALHEGLIVLAPPLEGAALNRLLGMPDGGVEPLTETLTERERQVLQLLAHGLANKQIALTLNISEHTVKFHVSAVYAKLGASSRTEAVRLGVQQGLVTL